MATFLGNLRIRFADGKSPLFTWMPRADHVEVRYLMKGTLEILRFRR